MCWDPCTIPYRCCLPEDYLTKYVTPLQLNRVSFVFATATADSLLLLRITNFASLHLASLSFCSTCQLEGSSADPHCVLPTEHTQLLHLQHLVRRPSAIDRGSGTREGPPTLAPSHHTAWMTTTTLELAGYLYSTQSESRSQPYSTSHTIAPSPSLACNSQQYQFLHSLDQSHKEQSDLNHFTLDLAATGEMSRHSPPQSSKAAQQYQLMSSESPADQAKSMSQVSPGFIFVIFPLSCVCFSSPPPPNFSFLSVLSTCF